MSLNSTIAGETEIAKTCILNSSLDDDVKRNLLTLLQKSAMATNGISKDEKIQSLTENMNSLAITLSLMLAKNDQRLNNLEQTYYDEHPKGDIERLQHNEKMLREVEEFRDMYGMNRAVKVSDLTNINNQNNQLQQQNTQTQVSATTIIDKIFGLLEKWYVWLCFTVAFCSPFAKDIITTIIQAFKNGV